MEQREGAGEAPPPPLVWGPGLAGELVAATDACKPTGGRKSLPESVEAVGLGRQLTGWQELGAGVGRLRWVPGSCLTVGWAQGSQLVHRKRPSGARAAR